MQKQILIRNRLLATNAQHSAGKRIMLFGVLRAKLRDKPRVDIEFDAFVEGNLCAQTSRTILNTLEVFVQVLFTKLSYFLMKNTIILCHNMIICTDYYQ